MGERSDSPRHSSKMMPRRQSHRLRRIPSRQFAINHAWRELALTGIDLLCGTKHLLLDRPFAVAEPNKLRYRLLYVAAN